MSGAGVINHSLVQQWYLQIRIRMCSIGNVDSSRVASGIGHWREMIIIRSDNEYCYCYI